MGALLVHIRHFDKGTGKAKSGVSFHPNQFSGILDLLGRGVGTHYLANISVNITPRCTKISRTDKGTSIALRRCAVDQIRDKKGEILETIYEKEETVMIDSMAR